MHHLKDSVSPKKPRNSSPLPEVSPSTDQLVSMRMLGRRLGWSAREQVDQALRTCVQMAGESKSRKKVDVEKRFRGRRRSPACLSLEQLQEIFH